MKGTNDLIVINNKLQDDIEERNHIEKELRLYQDQLITPTEHLEQICIIGPLTNITNRRGFGSCIKKEWNRVNRVDDYIGLILLNMDHFK